MTAKQEKRKVFRNFYRSLGAQAVCKCGIKSLDFRHIFEYFALETIK